MRRFALAVIVLAVSFVPAHAAKTFALYNVSGALTMVDPPRCEKPICLPNGRAQPGFQGYASFRCVLVCPANMPGSGYTTRLDAWSGPVQNPGPPCRGHGHFDFDVVWNTGEQYRMGIDVLHVGNTMTGVGGLNQKFPEPAAVLWTVTLSGDPCKGDVTFSGRMLYRHVQR